jgi:hypothetical protein
MNIRQIFTPTVAALLSGCMGLPPLKSVGQIPQAGENAPVSQVIKHIECEIALAMADSKDAAITQFLEYDYVVYGSLTFDEQFNQGISPSIGLIHPYATAGLSSALAANGEWNGQRHRNYTQNFSLDLDRNVLTPSYLKECESAPTDSGNIQGSLGLRQILTEGAMHRDKGKYHFPIVGDESNLTQQQKDAIGSISGQLTPSFVTIVDFTLAYGLTGGGPNWTLTHFTGPSGSAGLANWTKQNKNTLVLSFASWQKHVNLMSMSDADKTAAQTAAPVKKAMAATAAQSNVSRLLLNELRLTQ